MTMPVIPEDQPPLCSSEVEKKSKRIIFACSKREYRLWHSMSGRKSLSYNIRQLLNAWAKSKLKDAQR